MWSPATKKYLEAVQAAAARVKANGGEAKKGENYEKKIKEHFETDEFVPWNVSNVKPLAVSPDPDHDRESMFPVIGWYEVTATGDPDNTGEEHVKLSSLGMSKGDIEKAKSTADSSSSKVSEEKGEMYGGWKPNFGSNVSPERFLEESSKSKMAHYLTKLTPDEISDHKIILSEDGLIGALVSKDGDIRNVFNNGAPKGAGAEVMFEAIRQGGKTLDCYDKFLPDYYSNFGFEQTGRMKFSRDYAPEGWDYDKDGEPDVVFMALKKDVEESDARKELARGRDQWASVAAPNYYEPTEWDRAKSESRAAGVSEGIRGEKGSKGDSAGNKPDTKSDGAGGRAVGFATDGVPDEEGNISLRNGLKVSRAKLPQIKGDDIPEFVESLRGQGVKVEEKEIKPGDLKPVQAQVNQEKIDGMIQADRAGTMDVAKKPVMVSSDGYLIDGHHRAVASDAIGKPMKGKADEMRKHGHEVVAAYVTVDTDM